MVFALAVSKTFSQSFTQGNRLSTGRSLNKPLLFKNFRPNITLNILLRFIIMAFQTFSTKYSVAGLLGISGIALSSLVPGGPIETRSFAHINPLTLGIFNTFLTTLALGSLILVYFVLKSERWAMVGAALCGLSFFGVYVADLAVIFPVSPDAMPPALLAIEIFGTILSLILMWFSMQAWQTVAQPAFVSANTPHIQTQKTKQVGQIFLGIVVGTVALGIIIFATNAAMGL
jgi:hypothetical protein